MLGLRMLQKANFPTFMGNSLVIDTINVTGPYRKGSTKHFLYIFWGLVPGLVGWMLGFVSWMLGIVCRVLGLVFWVSGFVIRMFGFVLWVSGFPHASKS